MTYKEAKAWAEDLCSRAEYSSGEIRQRLLRKEISPDIAERIISELICARFIDDARFARAFVHQKVKYARWGRRKIAAALFQKGVGREQINDALNEIDHDEYIEGLAELLRSKMRSLRVNADNLNFESKRKLYNFAAQRGFESSAVGEAMGKWRI